MSGLAGQRLFFVIDAGGGLVAFREHLHPWAGVVAFTDESSAARFIGASGCQRCEVVELPLESEQALAELIAQVKPRGIRHLLLDLDYASGNCTRYDFIGNQLSEGRGHRFVPGAH